MFIMSPAFAAARATISGYVLTSFAQRRQPGRLPNFEKLAVHNRRYSYEKAKSIYTLKTTPLSQTLRPQDFKHCLL